MGFISLHLPSSVPRATWKRIKLNPAIANYFNDLATWEGDFLVTGSVRAAFPDRLLIETHAFYHPTT